MCVCSMHHWMHHQPVPCSLSLSMRGLIPLADFEIYLLFILFIHLFDHDLFDHRSFIKFCYNCKLFVYDWLCFKKIINAGLTCSFWNSDVVFSSYVWTGTKITDRSLSAAYETHVCISRCTVVLNSNKFIVKDFLAYPSVLVMNIWTKVKRKLLDY